MDHLLLCPALTKEHLQLKEDVKAKFQVWNFPYASIPLRSSESEIRERWRAAARKKAPSLSNARLDILTHLYWKINIQKQFVSTNAFTNDLITAIAHRYPIPVVHLRQDLVALLAHVFVLQTHCFTDSLNYSPLFDEWTSINDSDVAFGAKFWKTPSLHSGRNSFTFIPLNTNVNIQGLLEIFCEALQSQAPSRFICVIPKQMILPSQFLELVTFDTTSPLFYWQGDLVSAPSPISIVLAMNKQSALIDPINWEFFKSRLFKWSEDWRPGLVTVSEQTNFLFTERTPLLHSPRALSKQQNNLFQQPCSIINFFDAYSPRKSYALNSLPPRVAALIGQMNRHPTFLGVLGILPNQLRSLLKETGCEDREEILLDLSRTLFFAGFRVWKKRQKLAKHYWNNVKQRQLKEKTKRKKPMKKQVEEKIVESKCQNPFHYLRRHENLSSQRPTKCPCRNAVVTKLYRNQPITEFASEIQFSEQGTNVHRKENKSSSQENLYLTRTDIIRKEHDRGKKRPFKQLSLDLFIAKKRIKL